MSFLELDIYILISCTSILMYSEFPTRAWTAGSFGRTPVTVYFIIFKVICNVFVDIVRFYFCRDNEDILTW